MKQSIVITLAVLTIVAFAAAGCGSIENAFDRTKNDVTGSLAPSTPTLTVSGTGAGSVSLSWTEFNANNLALPADSYTIVWNRCTTTCAVVQSCSAINQATCGMATVPAPAGAYTFNGLQSGGHYSFVIAAENKYGASAPSLKVDAVPL